METKEPLQRKLLEQDEKHKEEEKLRKRIEELEKKLERQDKELVNLKKILEEHTTELTRMQQKLEEQRKQLEAQTEEHKEEIIQKLAEQKKVLEELFNSKLLQLKQSLPNLTKSQETEVIADSTNQPGTIYLKRRFEMKNFSGEKDKCGDWKSPAMYTHACGYKFCIGVAANGDKDGHGTAMSVDLWAVPGQYDKRLKWPVMADITIELINLDGGENAVCSTDLVKWEQPTQGGHRVAVFPRIRTADWEAFIEHSKLDSFLDNDTLHFFVSEIVIL